MPHIQDGQSATISEKTQLVDMTEPGSWQAQDVGSVAVAGSAELLIDRWRVHASGQDIWGNQDEFHFVHWPASGDVELIVRLDGLEATHAWAKAGLMMREGLTAGARYAFAMLRPGGQPGLQHRNKVGDNTFVQTGVAAGPLPRWLRLTRLGDRFTAAESANSRDWTEIAHKDIAMATDLQVGLAVTSHADGIRTTALFSELQGTAEAAKLAQNTITSLMLTIQADPSDRVTIDGEQGRRRIRQLDGAAHPADPGHLGNTGLHEFLVEADGADASTTQEIAVTINASPAAVIDDLGGLDKHRTLQHLLQRTGFGASLADLQRYAGLDYDAVVDQLVDGISHQSHSAPPFWINEPQYSYRERGEIFTADQQRDLQQRILQQKADLKIWWFREMLATPSPLTERLVLFWHNIWTSSLEGVHYAQIMYRQNVLIRANCTDFAAMARTIPSDPAMVLYLDSDTNVKGSPNENFARELLELFSLGQGQNYTEQDVVEIARCFTGYSLTPNFAFEYRPELHDDGEKIVFGKTGNFTGDDIISMILAKRRAAVYICENLWDEFIAGARQNAVIGGWAEQLMADGYRLEGVLKTLFKSKQFKAGLNRSIRIKAPVELLVGIYRSLDLFPANVRRWIQSSRDMGQDLLEPPNVRGWPGGLAWIDATSLINRINVIRQVGYDIDDRIGDALQDGFASLMLAVEPIGIIDQRSAKTVYLSVLADPTFNLA